MEEGFVNVNTVPTRVISIGGWIDQPVEKRNLILIIPGNPGLIGYYETFAHSLYETVGKDCLIWGLGHGGHEVPSGASLPNINKNNQYLICNGDHPELFTLEGQVVHKMHFINQYVPKDVKLHLIGHSIGSKICLELLTRFRESGDHRRAYAYLLFPTLERMAQTPNGRRMWPILGPLRKPLVLAVSLIYRLPELWLTTLIRWFLGSKIGRQAAKNGCSGASAVMINTTLRLLHPQALERSLFMAHDELKVVGPLNVEHIRQHSDKLTLYFGTKDKWCPLEYAHNFQNHVPEARAVICSQGMEHAFVLQSSQQMATIVAQWIQERF